MLQHGRSRLVPQHHQEVGAGHPGPQRVLAHHPRRDSAGPAAGRQRPHQPGQVQSQAGTELTGPEPGGQDPGHGLHRVLVADAEELEGGVR